jgi:hypothetical protein
MRGSVNVLACRLSGAGLLLTTLCFALPRSAQQAQGEAGRSAVNRRLGAIRAIDNNVITLAPDSGAEINVTVNVTTRILRVAPGEKNLKNASAAQLQDLQVGDRILVGGEIPGDGKSITASSIVVMKHSDVEARQEQALKSWQRGVGGLVTAVDPASRTATISVTGFGGTRSVVIHASEATVIRRYASDSIKFEDAKPSTLAEIHPGDQLRARGSRGPDGTELTAEEIVSGSFRNVAGTVNSVDPATGTISVDDLLSKKLVHVRIAPESQLRKLPPEVARRLAARLKGGAAGTLAATGTSPQTNSLATESGNGQRAQPGSAAGMGPASGGMGGSGRSGGAPDFQQMLNRMPAVTLGDLHKGDAVMLVATQGTSSNGSSSSGSSSQGGTSNEVSSNEGTAITLLTGVEPILQAAPSGGRAMMLTPWSLGGPSGDGQNQ